MARPDNPAIVTPNPGRCAMIYRPPGGNPGQVWLINREQPLAPETPSQVLSLGEALDRSVALSKHLWQPRGQILALLAPGSQVASAGQEYLGRVEGEGQLVWAAPRSPQTLGSLGVTLTIQDSGAIAFTFPSDLWVLGERNETEILTSFRVTQAVLAPDATQLAWGSWSGQNSSLTLAVLDLAGVSDYVNSEFHLTLASRDPRTDRGGDRRYRTRFQGPLPAHLISRQHNRFELALGRLPLDLRDIQGADTRLELVVTRSLGPYSAT